MQIKLILPTVLRNIALVTALLIPPALECQLGAKSICRVEVIPVEMPAATTPENDYYSHSMINFFNRL